MSSNRSDSETDCDWNPLEEVEHASENDHKINESADEPKPSEAVKRRPRVLSGDRISKLWDIFEKDPEERGVASCRLCHRRLSYRTTITNLKKHLIHLHALEIDAGILPPSTPKTSEKGEKVNEKMNKKADAVDSDTECKTNSPPGPRPYRSNSIAWKYFRIVCRRRRRARCKLCSKMYSYATTVTNLLTHLERRHNNIHLEGNGQPQPIPTSPVWAYFKCLDEAMQLACCLICKKRLEYSEDCQELKRHLNRKHPHVDLEESSAGKTFMVTDEGDLFEIDVNKSEPVVAESDNDQAEFYDDADYLDETAYDEPEEIKKEKTKQNIQKIRKLPQKIVKQQSEVREFSKPKQVQEDSIDIFGRYIVSLLKKMPKNTSDKLQYQIVKQIFETQSEESAAVTENNVTSNSEKSPVIITHVQND